MMRPLSLAPCLVGLACILAAAPTDAGDGASGPGDSQGGDVGLLGAVVLYSRITPGHALRHRGRAVIHDCVAVQPGLTVTEIARRAGVHRKVAEYHLRVLLQAGLVKQTGVNGHALYWLAGTLPAESAEQVLAATAPATFARVLACVRAQPGITPGGVALQTGLSSAHVAYYVRRLGEQGLLRREGSRTRASLYPAGEA